MLDWMPAEKYKQATITEVSESETDASAPVEVVEQAASPQQVGVPVPEEQKPDEPKFDEAVPNEAKPDEPKSDESELDEPKQSFPEPPPDLGARYDILDFVGSGGMGSVWKVYDKTLGETFAIKVLNPDLIADATAVKRFEKEANLASDLTHANIAAIFGPGADSAGRPYIIMKYVDGESLAEIMAREGKLSEERAVDIFTQICEALQHSHMKGIIHRDIKPSNIIISKTESGGDMVHVVDFGIARSIHEEVIKTQALTKAVDVFGSPRYMSPEQLLGQEVTAQSDIYSLGCVFYEMLTGAPPFTDENPVRLILQHLTEYPDLRRGPVHLRIILEDCLSKEPAARFTNVDRLLEILSEAPLTILQVPADPSALHCLLTAFLIAIPGVAITLFSRQTFEGSVSVGMLVLAWVAMAALNLQSRVLTKAHRQVELNFLFCAIALALVREVAEHKLYALNMFIIPAAITAICILILRPETLTGYSRLQTKVLAYFMRMRSPLPLAFRAGYGKAMPNAERVVITVGIVTNTLCLLYPTFAFFFNTGFDTSVRSFDVPMTFLALNTCTMVLLITLTQILTNQASYVVAVQRFIRIQCLVIAVVLGATSMFLATAGRAGFNQWARQIAVLSHPNSESTRESIALEALNYPDTYLANEARMRAARTLQSSHNRAEERKLLYEQITSSQVKDELQLADALIEKVGLEINERSAEDRKSTGAIAFDHLLKAKPPDAFELERRLAWAFNGNRIVGSALNCGFFEVQNGNPAGAKRALELARKQPDSINLKRDLLELERAIMAFEKTQNSSVVAR